jgi:hypothetical protein
MTINQRLKEFFESKKIDAPAFYKKIGATRGDWSGWINTGKPIPVAKLQLIVSAFPELDSRWLLVGEGNMIKSSGGNLTVYRNEEKLNQVEDPEHIRKSNEDLRNYIKTQDRLILMQDEKIKQLTEEVEKLKEDKN